jgi:hypothetical protein
VALTFLLDEHLRGKLQQAIVQHNARGADIIDAIGVGDPPDLPLGSSDPDILTWAEREGRLLLTRDVHTMPVHFAQRLQAGRRSPGLLVLKSGCSLTAVVAALALIAHAGDPVDYIDQMNFIP